MNRGLQSVATNPGPVLVATTLGKVATVLKVV
jgi:hypothetical protein